MKNLKNFGLALFVVCSLTYCTSKKDSAEEQDSVSAVDATEDSQEIAEDSAKSEGDDSKLVYDLVESMYGGIAVMKQEKEKATSPAVKVLAKKLHTQHTKLTEELKALTIKKNWTLPTGESVDDKEKRKDLAKKSGSDYDQHGWMR